MKLIIYQDKRKEWRWRIRARNGRIMADSGEGYKRKLACKRACYKLLWGNDSIVI